MTVIDNTCGNMRSHKHNNPYTKSETPDFATWIDVAYFDLKLRKNYVRLLVLFIDYYYSDFILLHISYRHHKWYPVRTIAE